MLQSYSLFPRVTFCEFNNKFPFQSEINKFSPLRGFEPGTTWVGSHRVNPEQDVKGLQLEFGTKLQEAWTNMLLR